MDKVTTGKIKFISAPSFQPPAGSHCSLTANTSTNTGAITKLGTTMPVIAPLISE